MSKASFGGGDARLADGEFKALMRAAREKADARAAAKAAAPIDAASIDLPRAAPALSRRGALGVYAAAFVLWLAGLYWLTNIAEAPGVPTLLITQIPVALLAVIPQIFKPRKKR
ncbi:MAG: hypothetical protein AB7P23_04830 [Amphiplicatus sp.]